MTETPESDYTNVSVPDDALPEDLQPGEDNPLADPSDDDADRQDMGDPRISGLERDSDDNLAVSETDDETDDKTDDEDDGES
jgi:hypothetical protein